MIDKNAQETLFQQLDKHTTILTPNRRLSATLHKLYQDYQSEQQQKCWQTPDILPVISWIQRLWYDYTSREFTPTPLILNTAQEQYLWEKIVLSSKDSDQLLQVSETAEIAKTAWGLLKQWQVDIHQPLFTSAQDYAALYYWATEFENQCETQNWIDQASVSDLIIAKIKSGEIKPAQQIILIGFTEITPQLKAVLHHCELTGSSIHYITTLTKTSSPDCKLISLTDNEQEIIAMARYAKSLWDKNQNVSMGCVIPSLETIRDRVRQIFTDVFESENIFNISAGKSLTQYPIINAALCLLFLYKKNITLDTLSYLLTSPFIGEGEAERIKRCTFDSLLRKSNVTHLNLERSSQKNEDSKILSLANYCPHLARRFRQFYVRISEQDHALTYTAWASFFNQLLTVLGWPGERSLSSEEYQIVESWLKLLGDYTSLDLITHQPVNFSQALHALQKMASKALFQPKTPQAPIQILGVLEAAALPFDYLWIAGMDDLSWPPQPKPNPFIPKRLQRELHMPHATAERELTFCQSLIQQFQQSAEHIIFSHAEKQEELELQASPLVRHYTSITLDELGLPPYATPGERIYQTRLMEYFIDDTAPALLSDASVKGGVNVLKQQALCPFKAFSECRLHAQALENPVPGLRTKDRGNIVHKILELVWNQLQDHHTLVNIDRNELHQLIDKSISIALETTTHSRNDYTQYLALEKKRLHQLIHDWLYEEKQRPSFKVMTSEKSAQITIGKLNLAIRIDRIDEIENGKKFIIDYKTGKNSDINSWFGERLDEPQLPLYALLDSENTIGIAFAQVASGETCFKGVSPLSLDIQGIKALAEIKKANTSSWSEQVTQWTATLTKLSDDFYHGVAKVDPKEAAQTCLWCDLKPLCRINEER